MKFKDNMAEQFIFVEKVLQFLGNGFLFVDFSCFIMYSDFMIKYWLIISVFSINGEVIERHEFRYKNEVACYLAMEKYESNGRTYQAECVARDR